MSGRQHRLGTILRAIVHEVRAEQITFMAGTIAYNAFLSLLPLLFLLLALIQTVGGGELESSMIQLIEALVTPGASDILVSELRGASVGASLVGIAALVWGMLRIFRSLDMAFSDIYETQAENTFLNQIVDGITVFASIAAIIVGFVVVESAFGITSGSGPLWVLQRGLIVFVVALALVPMYYVFPDETDMSILETAPGVLFTALALVSLQSGFSLYVDYSSQAAENTMLASILIFLTWLYACGLVVLLGAAINAVLTNRSEDVNIDPVIGGVPRVAGTPAEAEDVQVPGEAITQLDQSLAGSRTLSISVDGEDHEYRLRAPDIVTVDTDTSALPGITDTASIQLQWSESGIRADAGE